MSSITDGDVMPLANLRQWIVASIGGIAIGISPCDNVLYHLTHKEMNKIIKRIFSRRGIPFCIVGEWSPTNHRWHYHGFCKVQDFKKLDSLKRRIHGVIGRVVTEQIHNDEYYCNYMLKIYESPVLLNTIQPFLFDSIVSNIYIIDDYISKAERAMMSAPSDADRHPGAIHRPPSPPPPEEKKK